MSCTGFERDILTRKFERLTFDARSQNHTSYWFGNLITLNRLNNLLRTNVFSCLRDLLTIQSKTFETHFRLYAKRETDFSQFCRDRSVDLGAGLNTFCEELL